MSGPVLYTVTCRIDDPQTAAAWVDWLRGGHMEAVIKGGAVHATLVQTDDRTYQVHYLFPDRARFDHYEATAAPVLRAEGLARFPASAGFTYSRSVADVLFDSFS